MNFDSLFNRSVAALIDNALWFFGAGFLLGFIPESTYDNNPEVAVLSFLLLASLWFNYFAFCEWRWGQTVGKKVMGSRVLMADGSKAAFGPVSIRNVMRIVDFFAIGPLMISSTKLHQRLGDKFAGTVVVSERTKPVRSGPPGAEQRPEAPESKPSSPRRGDGIAKDVTWGGRTARGTFAGLAFSLLFAPLPVLLFDPDFDTLGGKLTAQALLDLTLVATALYMARGTGAFDLRASLSRLGYRRFRFSALGVMLATMVVYYIAIALFSVLFIEPDQEDIGGELGLDEGTFAAIAAIVLIVGIAPLTEEAFFRGFLFGGLRTKWSLWPSALVSGAVFGLIHAPTGITTVIPLAMIGIAFAWLYERTGSLWPPIIAHAINNALALSAGG